MVRAKNYDIASTFVKVMQKKLWLCFFGTPCIDFSVMAIRDFISFRVNSSVNLTDYGVCVCFLTRLFLACTVSYAYAYFMFDFT